MSDILRPTTLSISLPDDERAWIDEQVAASGYGSASDLVRALIAAERERRAQERLEELLLEGVNSGPGEVVTQESWDRQGLELEARAIELRQRKGVP